MSQETTVVLGSAEMDVAFSTLLLPDRRCAKDQRALPPLGVCSKQYVQNGVSTAYLHFVDDLGTGNAQVLAWTPNEGLITGLGGNGEDGCIVCVSDRKKTIIFEFFFNKNIHAPLVSAQQREANRKKQGR
jgi:hypothetical protein